jgi:hypothetical protein
VRAVCSGIYSVFNQLVAPRELRSPLERLFGSLLRVGVECSGQKTARLSSVLFVGRDLFWSLEIYLSLGPAMLQVPWAPVPK